MCGKISGMPFEKQNKLYYACACRKELYEFEIFPKYACSDTLFDLPKNTPFQSKVTQLKYLVLPRNVNRPYNVYTTYVHTTRERVSGFCSSPKICTFRAESIECKLSNFRGRLIYLTGNKIYYRRFGSVGSLCWTRCQNSCPEVYLYCYFVRQLYRFTAINARTALPDQTTLAIFCRIGQYISTREHPQRSCYRLLFIFE